jgi:hypothetical protein
MNIGTTINSSMAASLMAEDMSDASSNESTQFDDTDLLNSSVHDDVTAQLAAAGKYWTGGKDSQGMTSSATLIYK